MYKYLWDVETGGLLLTNEQSKFSKEPRPVYYKELDALGFGQYWSYLKYEHAPLMWAEANNYIYKGRTVAKVKGGSLYTAPELVILEEPEPNGGLLQFVDVERMVAKNQPLMETMSQEAIQKIYNTYCDYKHRTDPRKKVEIFYVAFSGGKDSIVVLDLVQRALPHSDFKVMFGNTDMEFSTTTKVISDISNYCHEEGIDFWSRQYRPRLYRATAEPVGLRSGLFGYRRNNCGTAESGPLLSHSLRIQRNPQGRHHPSGKSGKFEGYRCRCRGIYGCGAPYHLRRRECAGQNSSHHSGRVTEKVGAGQYAALEYIDM